MIDNLKRIREPVAWIVLATVAAGLVLGIVRLVMLLLWEKVPAFAAFQDIGLSLMNLALVIALIGLVCACMFLPPATPRALTLARVGAVVVGVGTVLQLICLVMGVAASANALAVIFEILGGLLDVVLKAVAAGVLWVLHRGADAGRLDMAPPPAAPAAELVPAEPTTPAVWQPEQATGTAWRTANEAAAGARPGESTPPADAEKPPVTPESRWRPIERPASSDGHPDARG